MKTIQHSKIKVPEYRQRKTFSAESLATLGAAIVEVGLLQPIVLRDDSETLVAGERRYRAVGSLIERGMQIKFDNQLIPLGEIPYVTLSECDLIIAQKAELYENSIRENLTWQEKDEAILMIKALMEAKEGGREVSSMEVAREILTARKAVEDIATHELYTQKNKVDAASLRAQYSDDPRIANAKSAKEADKIIRKDLEKQQKAKLAEQFKEIESPHNIVMGDCCELIKKVPDGYFDVVCSDPIYGIGADDMHMFQRATYNAEGSHHVYDDSVENWERMFDIMPAELYRVCKEKAALYLFCDINRYFDFWVVKPGNKNPSRVKGLATRFREAGWTVWPRPLFWYKGNIGSLPKAEHGPRYTYECIIFATKGDKTTTGVYHDVVNIPQTTGHVHGAGKPAEVYMDLLRRSVLPGDKVLDFCAGSFPILRAANSLSVQADAWELDPQWEKEAQLNKNKKVGEE